MNDTQTADSVAACERSLERRVRPRRSDESRRKTAEAVRAAHARNPRTAESLTKIAQNVKRAHAEGRAGGYTKGNRLGAKRKPESVKRAHAACLAVVIGSHGFGCMEKEREDHLMAKRWEIVSPDGVRYSFGNLNEWCRAHEHLLPPDEAKYKTPLWDRAAHGLSKQAAEKDPRHEWRGWRLVNVTERSNGCKLSDAFWRVCVSNAERALPPESVRSSAGLGVVELRLELTTGEKA